jgi:hypothetical protein
MSRDSTYLTTDEILLRIERIDVNIAQIKSAKARLDATLWEREQAKHRLESQLAMSSVAAVARAG